MLLPATAATPDATARLLARSPNRRRPVVMHHRWEDLLFLHWQVDPAEIQKTLPPELTVDTFNGEAYVGITPFFMRNVRLTGTPALPWFSFFLELNVRTYVLIKPVLPVCGFTRLIVIASGPLSARACLAGCHIISPKCTQNLPNGSTIPVADAELRKPHGFAIARREQIVRQQRTLSNFFSSNVITCSPIGAQRALCCAAKSHMYRTNSAMLSLPSFPRYRQKLTSWAKSLARPITPAWSMVLM